MIINDLYTNKTPAVAENALNEFAPSDGGGDAGNYFQALASAWYNGTFDTGSLQKGIKSQEDVEQLLQRGIVCPDGVTRKFDIGYNSNFDGVVISSDDYYEYADHDETDSRTGKPFGPYDYMEFDGNELDESAKYRDPKYKDKLYTQEPPDYNNTREYDDARWNPKPDDYAGRKRKIGGGEFSHNDPLRQGFGRSGIKNNINLSGKRKGLPSRDQITSLKGSIKDAHGRHARANLPEGMEGRVVFLGTGSNGVKYEIIQSGDGFMIHANGRHIDTYGSLERAMSVLKNEVPGLQQGVAEASLGDYRKKAAVNKAVAQANRFFGRDDPAAVAAADQTIAKRERGLARADARVRPYTPPVHDAEKYQRDLTAKYPNIDQLVADAERNRDPYYDRAEGSAYYAGREAEQNYQRLKQIQRVIQGLTESLQTVKEFNPFSKKKVAAPASTADSQAAGGMKFDLMGRPYKPLPVTAEPDPVTEPVTEPVAKPVGTAMPINPYQIPISNTNPTPAKPAVAPKTAMTTVNPPKFNTGAPYTAPDDDSELQTIPAPAQLTGPAPVKQLVTNYRDDVIDVDAKVKTQPEKQMALPAPVAKPDYSKGFSGYSNTTMNAPTASVPNTKSMRPANMMPRTATASTTSTAPTLTPTEKKEIYQYLTKTMKFGSKEAKDAIKNLPPGIGIKDAVKQIFRNSLGKSVTSESLTWSQNFNPGRSLYRRMKQDR
jgi:hypothetical protein